VLYHFITYSLFNGNIWFLHIDEALSVVNDKKTAAAGLVSGYQLGTAQRVQDLTIRPSLVKHLTFGEVEKVRGDRSALHHVRYEIQKCNKLLSLVQTRTATVRSMISAKCSKHQAILPTDHC
jgi:hypothetical protein